MTIEIDKVQLNLLVEEVLVQANLALNAYDNLRKLVEENTTRQRREVWAYMQSCLSHTAMISKFMSSKRGVAISRARATALTGALKITKDSPVLNRQARNNVEHLEERIDHWIEVKHPRMLEAVLQNRACYEFLNNPEETPRRHFVKRVYLIDEEIFISEGRRKLEEIDLKVHISEVRKIQEKAEIYRSRDSSVTRIIPM